MRGYRGIRQDERETGSNYFGGRKRCWGNDLEPAPVAFEGFVLFPIRFLSDSCNSNTWVDDRKGIVRGGLNIGDTKGELNIFLLGYFPE